MTDRRRRLSFTCAACCVLGAAWPGAAWPDEYERVEDAVCLSQEEALERALVLYTPEQPVEVREEQCEQVLFRVRVVAIPDRDMARDIERRAALAGLPTLLLEAPGRLPTYSVQLGAFDDQQRARVQVEQARDAGIGPVRIIRAGTEAPGYTVYRRIAPAVPETESEALPEETGETALQLGDEPPPPEPDIEDEPSDFGVSFPRLRAETGLLHGGGRPARQANYLHGEYGIDWQPPGMLEGRVGIRFDGYHQSGDQTLDDARLDYGESYLRFRGDQTRFTLGTQRIIWGRVDEIPPQDRLSTIDLNRFILDDLTDRRRAMPAARLEHFRGAFRVDAVVSPRFREAKMPHRDSIWHPVDRRDGRIAGLESDPMLADLVRAGTFEEGLDGDPVGGVRVTRSGRGGDFGLSIQRTRHGTPYYELHPQVREAAAQLAAQGESVEGAVTATDEPTFTARHPRTWVIGGDFGFNALGATWRGEAVWLSDVPATTRDTLELITVEGAEWVVGGEFYPGDQNLRMTVQLAGQHLLDPPDVLDRVDYTSLNVELEEVFAREAWRVRLRMSTGLRVHDFYFNPRVSYERWEPHEIYAAYHYFDGEDGTLGGYYHRNQLLTVGWQVSW